MSKVHALKLFSARSATPDFSHGSVLFVGTATVVIRYAGFTILTDPNFLHAGDHAHLGYGLTSRRLTNPALEIEELPPLDICLLSHYHGDHFDHIAAERLNKDLPIITTPHATRALHHKGFRNLHSLNTWDSVDVSKGEARMRVTSMPGRHAPGPLAALLPQVMGSMLEFGMPGSETLYSMYISGDTLLIDELKEIPKRYPDIFLGLFHLGGTKILGLLTVTMDAKQGVEAVRIIHPHTAIPIHYNDYTVFKSPLEDFKRAVAKADLPVEMVYLSHGEAYEFEVPAMQARLRAAGGG